MIQILRRALIFLLTKIDNKGQIAFKEYPLRESDLDKNCKKLEEISKKKQFNNGDCKHLHNFHIGHGIGEPLFVAHGEAAELMEEAFGEKNFHEIERISFALYCSVSKLIERTSEVQSTIQHKDQKAKEINFN